MAVTADKMKSQQASRDQFKKAYKNRQTESQNTINSTMDKTLATQKAGLKDAFKQGRAAWQEAGQAGQQAFQGAREDIRTQDNLNTGRLNQFAQARDVNTRQGSQQRLKVNRAIGGVMAAQQRALDENARQQDLLKVDYNNKVQAAIANRDYRGAAALLDDLNNQRNWLEKNAAMLAGYGNFTGYQTLYGSGLAGGMRDFWVAQNPDLAYNTGAINAKQYKKMTGKDAPDTVPKAGPGGSGGGLNNWWNLPEAHGGGNTTPAPTPGGPGYSNDTSAYWGDVYKF